MRWFTSTWRGFVGAAEAGVAAKEDIEVTSGTKKCGAFEALGSLVKAIKL